MLENVRLSFQGIWSHKMRSFLTMLGIIIGIASIISIVSTIKGTNEQIKQNLIGAGNNNVTVSLKQGDGDYWMDNGLPSGVSKLSDDQKKRIREQDQVENASFYTERTYVSGIAKETQHWTVRRRLAWMKIICRRADIRFIRDAALWRAISRRPTKLSSSTIPQC